jgi:RNA polymerase sigma-70 factor (ECF subfamily)
LWEEGQTPEQQTLRRLDAEAVQRLIAQLPDQFRETIVLREINELSYREIAGVIGAPVGTVMSRLARARERMAAELRGRLGRREHGLPDL